MAGGGGTSAELHSLAALKQGWPGDHLVSLACLVHGQAPPRAWVSIRSSRAMCAWVKAAWLGEQLLSQPLGLPGHRSQHYIQPSVGMGELGGSSNPQVASVGRGLFWTQCVGPMGRQHSKNVFVSSHKRVWSSGYDVRLTRERS